MSCKKDQQKKKRLAVVTGTRAEYGLLRPVLHKLATSEVLQGELLVTGAHLRPEYGETVKQIEEDSILPIAARLDILRFGNDSYGILQSVSLAVRLFGEWFAKNQPDACLVLGDRYEIFAAASAAFLMQVPVIHISGGDVTRGAQDDSFRHCISKLAALHFPYCEEYRQRLLRMGEEPQRVFNVGGLGSENVHSLQLLSAEALSEKFHFDFTKPYCLVTYHPETLAGLSPQKQFAELLLVLKQHPEYQYCFTKANADAGGLEINAMIDDFILQQPNSAVFSSMGVQGYLSAVKGCAAVIGNSSSGVVETPEFGVPCINIGDRQAGRMICDNVLCCATEHTAIEEAMQLAATPQFRAKAKATVSPFAQKDTSSRMVEIIADFLYSPLASEPKKFYDGE